MSMGVKYISPLFMGRVVTLGQVGTLVIYGREWTIVQQGPGPALPIIDYGAAVIPVGTVLADAGGQLWLVRDGASDLSQPGVNFAWLERYSESPPALTPQPSYPAPPTTISVTSTGTVTETPPPAPQPNIQYPYTEAASGSLFTESFEIAGYQIPVWALLAGGAALLFAVSRGR